MVDGVVGKAVSSQQIVAEIQDSLQMLPSAEDDITLLRIHDSCEDAANKLSAVQEKLVELESDMGQAETKVGSTLERVFQLLVILR